MVSRLRVALISGIVTLVTAACQNAPAPAPTIPAPSPAVAPARSPTAAAIQPTAAPTTRPPVSGGGVGRDTASPVPAGGGAPPTIAIPKPAVTAIPRDPPAPFVPLPDPPSPGNANPIGSYLTPLPKPGGLNPPAGGAGGGGQIPIATTGPATQLKPVPDVPIPPTPTVARVDPGGAQPKR